MRIALVSDTHLPRFGRQLPSALVEGLDAAAVDRILHAGDWTEPIAAELLEALAPIDGVAGNNDGPALHERFGTRLVLVVGGVRIGVTHGHLGAGRSTEQRALRAFADEDPPLDVIVFGHSHIPCIRRLPDDRWLVNPGSPTDKRRQPDYTWALMEIEDGAIASVELRRYGRPTAPSTRGAR
jgi:putative phosphoesterase